MTSSLSPWDQHPPLGHFAGQNRRRGGQWKFRRWPHQAADEGEEALEDQPDLHVRRLHEEGVELEEVDPRAQGKVAVKEGGISYLFFPWILHTPWRGNFQPLEMMMMRSKTNETQNIYAFI